MVAPWGLQPVSQFFKFHQSPGLAARHRCKSRFGEFWGHPLGWHSSAHELSPSGGRADSDALSVCTRFTIQGWLNLLSPRTSLQGGRCSPAHSGPSAPPAAALECQHRQAGTRFHGYCYWRESLPLGNRRARCLDSRQKIYVRTLPRVQTARGKVASTKRFVQDGALSGWGRGRAQGGHRTRCRAVFHGSQPGWSPTEVVSCRLGGGVWGPTRSWLEPSRPVLPPEA